MRKELPDLGRFSDPSLLILSSLSNGPKHGYAMMEDILQFSGTQLEPGTLYGAIARLERRGWIEALPFTLEHAVALARLPRHHRDPFDRALVAQARVEPLKLLTQDKGLSVYGEQVLLV